MKLSEGKLFCLNNYCVSGVSKLAKLDGSGSAKAFGVSGFTGNERLEGAIGGENSGSAGGEESSNGGSSAASSLASSSAASSSSSSSSSSSFITNTEQTNSVVAAIRACQTSKCTFEDGTLLLVYRKGIFINKILNTLMIFISGFAMQKFVSIEIVFCASA